MVTAGNRLMHRAIKLPVCLATAVGALGSPAEVEAQTASRRDSGVAAYGGVVFPLNDLRDSAKTGYHFGGMFDRRVSKSLAIRLDVAFNKFSDKTLSEAPTFREVGTNLLFGTVGAEVFPGGATQSNLSRPVSPYLLFGLGVYSLRFDHVCRGPACVGSERVGTTSTSPGFNVGAGSVMAVRGWSTFVQAGYHIILPKHRSTRLLLTSLGVRFR
jgi:hypothetical protein